MFESPQVRIPEWTPGDRLRKARTELGLSAIEFADLLGIDQQTVVDLEGDCATPREITLAAWSQATGVPVSWLQNGNPELHSDYE